MSASSKISNLFFSLNFYQKEAVADNWALAVYQVYFTDCRGKQISDIQKIIADKTSENAQERIFRCNFHLKSLKYDNKEIYFLDCKRKRRDKITGGISNRYGFCCGGV